MWTPELLSRERLRGIEEATRLLAAGKPMEAVELWCRLGEYFRAAPVLEKLGLIERAAAAYNLAGEHGHAGELYERAGRFEEAAQSYMEIGDIEAVSRLRARMLAQIGEHERAAELFAAGQSFQEAAQHFRAAGKPVKAARMYARGGSPEKAGALLVELKRFDDAARCFERAEDWKRAMACWKHAGKKKEVARCLGRMGHPYDAGCVCLEEGWTDAAIAWFESVPPLSEPFARAAEKLAPIYEEMGRYQDACRAMGDALGHVQPTEANVESFERWIRLMERTGDRARMRNVIGLLAASGLASPEVQRKGGGFIPTIHGTQGGPSRSAATRDFDAMSHHSTARPDANMPTMGEATPPMGYAPPDPWLGAMPVPPPHYQYGAPVRRRQPRQRYQVGTLIGRGGRGEVYEAYDLALRQPVALKRVRPDLVGDADARRRLQEEASLASRLDHPNIVKVYDIELTPPVQLSFELVQGRTLGEYMVERGGRLKFAELMTLLQPLCSALDYAHGRHVIHRDLKPGNVMVTWEGQVKLLDFGVARMIDTHRQRTREIVGTPYYMSPEQCVFEPVDPRSDIYALGCVIFEMAVGRPPFTEGEVLRHHIMTPPPSAEKHVEGLPEGFGSLVQRAMSKRPQDRYRTAGMLFAALAALPV